MRNVTTLKKLDDFLNLDFIKVHIDRYKNEKINKKKRDSLSNFFQRHIINAPIIFKEFENFLYKNITNTCHEINIDGHKHTKIILSVEKLELPDFSEYDISLLPDKSLMVKVRCKLTCTLMDYYFWSHGHELINNKIFEESNIKLTSQPSFNFAYDNDPKNNFISRSNSFSIKYSNNNYMASSRYHSFQQLEQFAEISLQYNIESIKKSDSSRMELKSVNEHIPDFEIFSSYLIGNKLSQNLKFIEVNLLDGSED